MRILIVDDLEENLYLLEILLKENGYKVIPAKNGVEALSKLRKESIDLIISDILMPRMDGFQLCRECKKDESLKKIPFIFYTATYTDKEDEKFALGLGAERFIIKPQEPDIFIKILKEVIEEYKEGLFVVAASKEPIKEEEIYLAQYNERLIKKLEKKVLDLEKSEKHATHLFSVLQAIRGINQLIVKEKNRSVLLQKACNILIKARGYNSAWLGFLKDEKTFAIVVGSPLKEIVSRFREQVLGGDYPPCIRKALIQKDLFLLINTYKECGDCCLKDIHGEEQFAIIRIEHNHKLLGLLAIILAPEVYINKEEKELLEELAGDLAFDLQNIELEEHLGKRTNALKKRVKELNCLWEISNLIEKPGISLEAIIQGIVSSLPQAWQYPEICCARVILKGQEFKTENFKETIWKQSSDIRVYKKPIGTIEVYYLEERPEIDEGPFQKEERNLIEVTTWRLGWLIEGKESEIELKKSYQRLQKIMEDTIYTIGKITEARDPYTSGHQLKVSKLSTAIAQEMKLPQDKIEGIRIASLIHDIGKIGMPAEILSKPSKLSEIEYRLIKNHSQIGYDILKSIEFTWPIAQIVLQHQERLNGSGYPQGLKGDDILLEAKIIAVADVIEAMSSHRPYRPALGIDKALEEISKNKGILYDPEVVDTCLMLFKEKEFKF
jgi:response regulator RpfG family c-di-GMP phosphodiesterase